MTSIRKAALSLRLAIRQSGDRQCSGSTKITGLNSYYRPSRSDTTMNDTKNTTSSSSSNTVQGSVLLPHYRTLEVRPGRIS